MKHNYNNNNDNSNSRNIDNTHTSNHDNTYSRDANHDKACTPMQCICYVYMYCMVLYHVALEHIYIYI